MWFRLEEQPLLKDFSSVLFAHDDTLLSIDSNNGHGPELQWLTFDQDSEVFVSVMRLLWQHKNMSDQEFVLEIHPQALSLLEKSPLFEQLGSPTIQVTKAHRGVTPKQHTSNVEQMLKTDKAQFFGYQKFLLRLAAYYHDIGKGVSAGIPQQEIISLMNEYSNPKHSYPDHDVISTLVLRQFWFDSRVQQFFHELGFDGSALWQMLLLMIRNHHFFEFKKPFDQVKDELRCELARLATRPLDFEAFGLLFFLAYADLCSNDNYRHMWQQDLHETKEIISMVKDAFWEQSATLFYALRMLERYE